MQGMVYFRRCAGNCLARQLSANEFFAESSCCAGRLSTRRGSAFERGFGEVARLGIKIGRTFSPSIAVRTMAENAVTLIKSLSFLSTSPQVSDVAFLRKTAQTKYEKSEGHRETDSPAHQK
jgi:hypothetical protein